MASFVPGHRQSTVYRFDDRSSVLGSICGRAEATRLRVAASKGPSLRVLDADKEGVLDGKKRVARNDAEWKFLDVARMQVCGGNGGNGCVAMRREKGEPLGGPSGGRGGRGGSVYLRCDSTLSTLASLYSTIHVRADQGTGGAGKNRNGCDGHDTFVPVPPGTIVRDLHTQRVAGELRTHGEALLVAKGGRGGRGNAAFLTSRRTAPKFAERGEPGTERWLTIELRLVADVGFVGMPNAGKSTLLKTSASHSKPKIANYPFTTIVPNLGVCDTSGLVLCDIPGLMEGASRGVGLGLAFLRHVQRCKVLLHVLDGTSEDPIADFTTINNELKQYDTYLANKPQVVILNKMDILSSSPEEMLDELKVVAGHSRVLGISAKTGFRVPELMRRLKTFVAAQPEPDLPPPPEISFDRNGLDFDSDGYEIISDPAYPGQWRVTGPYIEQVARMTHWEYPEAVERFGRQLYALGIATELTRRGATSGDLVMVNEYDFEFSPDLTNPYIPSDLFRKEEESDTTNIIGMEAATPWRPFRNGGYLDIDTEELMGFDEMEDWELLDEEDDDDGRTENNKLF